MLAVFAVVVGGAVALPVTPAAAASSDVAISQLYGGGGNSGATFTNDFVELRNTSAAAVTVTGWSVQYASASGTSWQVTALSGTVPAGGRYLVREAAGTGGTAPLPTPDATGSTNLSATSVGSGQLVDLPRTLPDGERYTYDFEGNSQVLDHILLSPGLNAAGVDYDVVHTNAEYADQDSDHDPQVARIRP